MSIQNDIIMRRPENQESKPRKALVEESPHDNVNQKEPEKVKKEKKKKRRRKKSVKKGFLLKKPERDVFTGVYQAQQLLMVGRTFTQQVPML